MEEFIEKLIEKICNKKDYFQRFYECEGKTEHDADLNKATQLAFDDCLRVIEQLVEEYNNGWISTDVELPTKNGWYWGYYVTSSYIGTDGVKHTECKYASIYWEDNLWLYDPRSFRTVDEVIAWKPIAPYQPKGE